MESSLQKFLQLPDSQWYYFRFWLRATLVAEGLMVIFNKHLFVIYLIIAGLFLIGLLLRLLKLYPGDDEPLILDFSAVIIAGIYALISQWLGTSLWRFLLIFCSSLIIIPHFIYIAKEK